MSLHKKLPVGRLGRLAKIAQVGARTGASLLFARDGSAAAEQAAEVLGSLRGLAAKVGQMASYVDGVVPTQHREAYETALKTLRAAAPASSPQAIRTRVEQELAGPLDRLFAEWDTEPFASASIGQVHRARMHDGREVAVKVQHPGIERAVENDLKNASVLESMVSMLGPRALNSKQMYDEISARFREELDYVLEAERQRWFARLHEGDSHIRVPQVIAERSSQRVLTSELVHGESLE
ncbi:MAG: ABC1 kinase family protein, partial [Polyangiales bacterium]